MIFLNTPGSLFDIRDFVHLDKVELRCMVSGVGKAAITINILRGLLMKRNVYVFVTLIFSLLLVLGCGQQNTTDLTNVAEQVRQAFNNHDAKAAADLYTEDAIYMIAGEPEPLRGRKAIEENYDAFFSGFPNIETEFPLIMVSGDHIMVEGITKGTHTGPFPTPEGDVPATGRKIEFRFGFVLKVNSEGLIEEDRTYFDSAVLMNQLGLNEPSKETIDP